MDCNRLYTHTCAIPSASNPRSVAHAHDARFAKAIAAAVDPATWDAALKSELWCFDDLATFGSLIYQSVSADGLCTVRHHHDAPARPKRRSIDHVRLSLNEQLSFDACPWPAELSSTVWNPAGAQEEEFKEELTRSIWQ